MNSNEIINSINTFFNEHQEINKKELIDNIENLLNSNDIHDDDLTNLEKTGFFNIFRNRNSNISLNLIIKKLKKTNIENDLIINLKTKELFSVLANNTSYINFNILEKYFSGVSKSTDNKNIDYTKFCYILSKLYILKNDTFDISIDTFLDQILKELKLINNKNILSNDLYINLLKNNIEYKYINVVIFFKIEKEILPYLDINKTKILSQLNNNLSYNSVIKLINSIKSNKEKIISNYLKAFNNIIIKDSKFFPYVVAEIKDNDLMLKLPDNINSISLFDKTELNKYNLYKLQNNEIFSTNKRYSDTPLLLIWNSAINQINNIAPSDEIAKKIRNNHLNNNNEPVPFGWSAGNINNEVNDNKYNILMNNLNVCYIELSWTNCLLYDTNNYNLILEFEEDINIISKDSNYNNIKYEINTLKEGNYQLNLKKEKTIGYLNYSISWYTESVNNLSETELDETISEIEYLSSESEKTISETEETVSQSSKKMSDTEETVSQLSKKMSDTEELDNKTAETENIINVYDNSINTLENILPKGTQENVNYINKSLDDTNQVLESLYTSSGLQQNDLFIKFENEKKNNEERMSDMEESLAKVINLMSIDSDNKYNIDHIIEEVNLSLENLNNFISYKDIIDGKVEKLNDVNASDVNASNVKASNVKASDVNASDVNASNVKASNVNASDVNASNVKASDVKASNVNASDVKASDEKASDENASNVNASNVETIISRNNKEELNNLKKEIYDINIKIDNINIVNKNYNIELKKHKECVINSFTVIEERIEMLFNTFKNLHENLDNKI